MEPPRQMIGHDGVGMRAVGRDPEASAAPGHQVRNAPQAPQSLVTHPEPTRAQRLLQAQAPIGVTTFPMERAQLRQQLRIGERPAGRRPPRPRIKPTAGDPKRAT